MVNLIAFPDHYEDPKKKGKEWLLQAGKAIWNNWSMGMPTGSIFAAKAARYKEISEYAMGRQSVDKYKRELLPEDMTDESWTKINWEPMANGMVLRNIAVAKLQKAAYNILATAINPQAKDAQDEEYAKMRIKIMMRDAMQKNAPQLANHPALQSMPGEPEDLEELQMEIDHNPKFIRARDIEQAVQLVFYENEMEKILDVVSEDIVDFGIGILKEGLDENNKVIIRRVFPDVFGCSYTRKHDFSDITWAFELVQVKLSDLSQYFEDEDMIMLQNKVAGKNGNPTTFSYNSLNENGYDLFKATVLDFEILSYDKRVTEEKKDKNGNLKISKTKPDNEYKLSDENTYTSKTIEVLYKGKWVVETDLIYQYGKAPNQKRSATIATMGRTKTSYHIIASSFKDMRAVGLTEAMIPVIDDLCMAVYKLRTFRNEMIPNGFDIDLAAIEDVALGAGGVKMTTMEVIDFFTQKGILISRRSGISMDQNVNYKAINPIATNQAENLASLYNDIQASKQGLRDITGLNELTDGSTPNARMLTTTANLANESTNNALWYLIKARKNLLEAVSKAVVQRLQVALKRGPYDGFNKQAGRWITVPKSIEDFDYDIMIEDKPSEDQKQIIMELVKNDIAAGVLDTSDVITIINSNNFKQAQILLSYKAKRNKKKMQDMALQNTNATAQAQMQSAQAAEQAKNMTADQQLQRDLIKINAEKSWDFEIALAKLGQANQAVETKAMTEIIKADMGQGGTAPQEPMMEGAAPDMEPQMMEQ